MVNRTVLFLEDDEDLQTLVCAYLRERGYQVKPARSAQEARAVLASTQVDAAIMDGQLPGMTGAGYIQEVRQSLPKLPIFVSRILHKPSTPHELFLWLEQVLAQQAAQSPALSVDEEIANAIAALSAEYGSRLAEKHQEIAAALTQAQQGSTPALEEALKLAHRLHGTAGSYGFAQVSAAAGRLEALLRPLQDGAGDWSQVHSALQELLAASSLPTLSAPLA